MTKIYISAFYDNGIEKYGLFYEDPKGMRQPLIEDFKQVLFDSEKEAQDKLDLIEAEKQREDAAEAFSLDEAKIFVESHNWKFATTYAKTAPHEYLVKKWLSVEEQLLYERFVQTMKANSVVGYFYGHKNNYLILGDKYYWYMYTPDNMAVDLINRTTTDYLEYRDGAYYYKEKASGKV